MVLGTTWHNRDHIRRSQLCHMCARPAHSWCIQVGGWSSARRGDLSFTSIYQFYSLAVNTTTIEAREKDKVATLVRRGKLSEVFFTSS